MNNVDPTKLVFPDKPSYSGVSYLDDYETFIRAFQDQGGLMAAGEIGEMIMRMANHYARHNLVQSRALKVYNTVAKEMYAQVENGKPISAAKAEILAAATSEAASYQEARVHVQNIEQCINALKALQRGVLNEHSYSGT